MSQFDRAVFDASVAVDRVFGNLFLLIPMMKLDPNGPEVADPSRPANLQCVAVYTDPEAKPLLPNALDTHAYRRPEVEAGKPTIEISPAAAVCLVDDVGAPVWVGTGDQIRRVKDGATWRVDARFVTNSGVIRLRVNRIK